MISPLSAEPEVLSRDVLVMAVLTVSLFIFAYGFRGPARLNRIEGGLLLACYPGYTFYLASSVLALSGT